VTISDFDKSAGDEVERFQAICRRLDQMHAYLHSHRDHDMSNVEMREWIERLLQESLS
jgi:hypothetical protein